LHYHLDVPLTRDVHQAPLWLRYADNIVYAAHSVSEGLKGKDGVIDLAGGEEAQVLGFTLRMKNDRLQYNLGLKALGQLTQHLIAAHQGVDPPMAAQQTVLSLIDACGPVFENGGPEEILRLAASQGFPELPGLDMLRQAWETSRKRWLACREAAFRGMAQGAAPRHWPGLRRRQGRAHVDEPEAGVVEVTPDPGYFFPARPLSGMIGSALPPLWAGWKRFAVSSFTADIGGHVARAVLHLRMALLSLGQINSTCC
jgi:hypothetical protein